MNLVFEINRPLDKFSLFWAVGLFAIGLFAFVRGRNIVRAMREISGLFGSLWQKRGFTSKQLEDEMTAYTRLFSVVWIACGLFWTYWVLFHHY